MKYKSLLILDFLIIIVLIACQNATQTEPTPPAAQTQVTSTNTVPPPPSPTFTSTPTATATPSPPATPTTRPTNTPRPTITPIPPTNTPLPTATVIPFVPLDQTAESIYQIIKSISPARLYPIYLYRDDIQRNQSLNSGAAAFYQEYILTEGASLTYEDINFDGHPDLIAVSQTYVAIFLRNGETYEPPFVYVGMQDWFSSRTRYSLSDWTHDGQSEIIIDHQFYDHLGTGVWTDSWYQIVVTCDRFSCHPIWYHNPLFIGEQVNTGGVGIRTNTAILSSDDNSLPQITVTNEMFNFNGMRWVNDGLNIDPRIFTTTQTIFTWTGEVFTPTSTIELSPTQLIQTSSVLSATFGIDKNAEVNWTPNYVASPASDICQLHFQGIPIGKRFGCQHQYTQLEWRNLLNDEQPELLLTTLAGHNPIDEEGNELDGGINCLHQRMFIYRLGNNDILTEIADVAGCVLESDLLGVRLEDYNQDGTVDIVTAAPVLIEFTDCLNPKAEQWRNCWPELNTDLLIYRWNGTTFTLSETITDNEQ